MSLADGPLDPLFIEFQSAVAGRYSVDRELGRGGMGVVYLAREVHLDRLVAIKLLPPERAANLHLRQRFLREARLAAKLSHPNIIPIHAVEERDALVFYVMAFVDGETLAERVRRRGPLPGSEATRILREVAWALAYAHGQGLIHRDVKPDNILLETATGRVLVTDFGIAAAMDEVSSEGVAGTPEFMSPEQALGKALDARSDLYSLGAAAYFALSGRHLFDGDTPTEVLAKQVTEQPEPLAAAGLPVPRRLASLVDRCLAKSPEDRPPSAESLAEQLGVALEQRKELPAALRAFVKRYGRLDGGGTLIGMFAVLVGSNIIAAFYGGRQGVTAFALGLTALPFAYLVRAAARLSRLGFTHQDLGPAYQAEIEQAREELSVERRMGPTRVERLLGLVARLGGSVAGLSLAAIWLGPSSAFFDLLFLFSMSGGAALLSLVGRLALMQRRTDVDTEFWAKVWQGRLGRLAFALAKRLVGSRTSAAPMTHRATELSLGMAAEQLFESLPASTRKQLGDLPALLSRLQHDAQVLRNHYTGLQEAFADLGEAASAPEHVELREVRDQAEAKLGEAVGALETIRLSLLRLHAGSVTVAGLTTHLGLAAEVSAEVERLLAAREETERVLRKPETA
jgi:serine/threonine-protein kinase